MKLLYNRLVYALLFAAVWVYAALFHTTLATFMLYTLILLPLCSLAYCVLSFFTVRLSLGFSEERPVKGQEMEMRLTIRNRSPLPLPYLVVRVALDPVLCPEGSPSAAFEFGLGPFEKRSLSFKLRCLYHGEFEAGVDSAAVVDFLRLFRLTRRYGGRKGLLIYPRLFPSSEDYFRLEQVQDGLDAATRSIDTDISEVRDMRQYAQGDSQRHVHWKLTAKKGELLVKRFEETGNNHMTLVYDIPPDAPGGLASLDLAASVAVSLFSISCDILCPLTVITAGDSPLPVAHTADFNDFGAGYEYISLRCLERRRFRLDGLSFLSLPEGQGRLVFVTADPTDAFLGYVGAALHGGAKPIVVLAGEGGADKPSAEEKLALLGVAAVRVRREGDEAEIWRQL